MISSFHKNKEKRMKDMRRRFHYDPQIKNNKSHIVSKQKVSQIIIRDQNGQFSSVKEKNQFNDSSWLAKLVNGIQQSDNPNSKPLSDLQCLYSMGSQNTNFKNQIQGQFYTITRKSSDPPQRSQGRKSVPTVNSNNSSRNYQKLRENSKLSCHTITMQQENKKQDKIEKVPKTKYEKWTTQNSQNGHQSKKSLSKIMRNSDKSLLKIRNKNTSNEQQKQQSDQQHKNSIINYSSIRQQDKNFETNKDNCEQGQKIVIDLDQISLKTDISKQATPLPAKIAQRQARCNERQFIKSKEKYRQGQNYRFATQQADNSRQSNLKPYRIKFSDQSKSKKEQKKVKQKNTNQSFKQNNYQSTKSGDKNKKAHQNKLKVNSKQSIQSQLSTGQLSQMSNAVLQVRDNNTKLNYQRQRAIECGQYTNNRRCNNTPVKKDVVQPSEQVHKDNSNLHKQKQNQSIAEKENYFSSYNQFLDTFKQQPFKVASEKQAQTERETGVVPGDQFQALPPAPKVGMIKKNKLITGMSKSITQEEQIKKICLKELAGSYSQQARIPTFSERPIDQYIPNSKDLTDRENQLKKYEMFSPLKYHKIKKQSVLQKSVQTIKKGESPLYIQQQKKAFKYQRVTQYEGKSINSIRSVHHCHNSSINTVSLGQNQRPAESPKFNYSHITNVRHEETADRKERENKSQYFQWVFSKLDSNQENKIHKDNCNQLAVSEQERYEFGSIVSKIKYLGRTYSKNEFILQCMKIHSNSYHHDNLKDNNKINSNYLTFKPGNNVCQPKQAASAKYQYQNQVKSRLSINNISHPVSVIKSAPRKRQTNNDNQISNQNIFRANIMRVQKNSDKPRRIRKIQQRQENTQRIASHPYMEEDWNANITSHQFEPLFPQTTPCTQLLTKSPYLQMPSLPSDCQIKANTDQINGRVQNQKAMTGMEHGIPHRKDKNDIGNIIDSLNNKLSNYIQTNNLEDTYRKFKLQFVQLRRNMEY